jgi:hypothetical protein
MPDQIVNTYIGEGKERTQQRKKEKRENKEKLKN